MHAQVIKTGSHTFDRVTFKSHSRKLNIDVGSPLVQNLDSLNVLTAHQDTVTTNEIIPGETLVLRAGKQVGHMRCSRLTPDPTASVRAAIVRQAPVDCRVLRLIPHTRGALSLNHCKVISSIGSRIKCTPVFAQHTISGAITSEPDPSHQVNDEVLTGESAHKCAREDDIVHSGSIVSEPGTALDLSNMAMSKPGAAEYPVVLMQVLRMPNTGDAFTNCQMTHHGSVLFDPRNMSRAIRTRACTA